MLRLRTPRCARDPAGFTLVELVVVIVLLAILAAVALPRFMDVRDEAITATLMGVEGSLRSGVAQANAQARVQDEDESTGSIVMDGAPIPLAWGYPVAHWNNAIRYLIRKDTVEWTPAGRICEASLCARGNQRSVPGAPSFSSGYGLKIWPGGYEWDDACGVYYQNLEDGSEPRIGVIDSGC